MGNGWKLRLVYPHFEAIFSWEIHGKYMGNIMEIVHWKPYWALLPDSKVARAVEKHPKDLDVTKTWGEQRCSDAAHPEPCCKVDTSPGHSALPGPLTSKCIRMYWTRSSHVKPNGHAETSDVLGKNRAPYIRPINSNLHPTWVDSHHQHYRIPIDKIRHPGRAPATVEALWPLSPKLSKATAQKSWKPVSNHKQSGYGLYSSCHF